MTTTAADSLKYAAAILASCTDWACDSIGGSMCGHRDDETRPLFSAEGCSDVCSHHDDELNAIADTVKDIRALAALYGDPDRYSDGRRVRTTEWIDQGLATSHIWQPDPLAEEPQSWRGHLLSGDPDVPSPGVYEVETKPATQEIFVRVVRTA